MRLRKIKISAVSYLNTLPFIYGIEQHPSFLDQIMLSKDIPSVCAEKLIKKEVDLGLVPAAVIPELEEAHIVSDFCIAANGKVESVLLLSEVPINQVSTIYLDYQSRTSVKLCQLLVRDFWKLKINFISSEKGYEKKIGGKVAGVVIGDRTFHLAENYPYRYDLAEEWKKWQGLPFVFAAWVSNTELPKSFLEQFNQVLSFGVHRIPEAIQHYNLKEIEPKTQKKYLQESIDYHLDINKKEALTTFLQLVK